VVHLFVSSFHPFSSFPFFPSSLSFISLHSYSATFPPPFFAQTLGIRL
jgi:hypothetical protein